MQEGKLNSSTDNLPVLGLILSAGAVLIILAALLWLGWSKYKKRKDAVVQVTASGDGQQILSGE